ncbi:hypothetical protein MMC09_006784, partial [Bachmanniomyces sp. S44760]|nr:hypothetical protein [Bachmanniomyces sp. S44760]
TWAHPDSGPPDVTDSISSLPLNWSRVHNSPETTMNSRNADKKLGNQVVYPASPQYNASIESYWSGQSMLSPSCIVEAYTAADVSTAIKILVPNNGNANLSCKFAVRSGGHTPNVNANNINDGVTIDLSNMNKTTLNADNSVASIQPGSRWRDVYNTLIPTGFQVTGGRAATVGVAGLVTGGGNSFYAAKAGFACDNVKNWEVVLANGTIINANNASNPDLFTALKGGSGNFGIVTSIDMYTFKAGNLWGGESIYPGTTRPAQLAAFKNFTDNVIHDTSASLIMLESFVPGPKGGNIFLNILDYTSDFVSTPQLLHPAAYDELLNISGQVSNTFRTTNLTDLVEELEAPYGVRNFFATLTVANDLATLNHISNISDTLLAQVKGNKDLTGWTVMFQPIPSLFAQNGVARGGNVLGLPTDKNLVLYLFFVSWTDPANDNLYNGVAQNMINQVNSYTSAQDTDDSYIYLNYAIGDQPVFKGYGTENTNKLCAAALAYDPGLVFQLQVPGGFKLTGLCPHTANVPTTDPQYGVKVAPGSGGYAGDGPVSTTGPVSPPPSPPPSSKRRNSERAK